PNRDAICAEVVYEPYAVDQEHQICVNHAALPAGAKQLVTLRLFVDGSVLELFLTGTTAITERAYAVPSTPLRIVIDGRSSVRSVSLWQMKPISPDRLTS